MDAVAVESEGIDASGNGPGKFCSLDREIWAALWSAPTRNRMNLVTAFLVLLAGTGRDNQTTKWSARACEERVGMGKPRAKVAIAELIAAGLVSVTETATRLHPQYRLRAPSKEADPIFLPVQLVTGLADETPLLRRVREIGDANLLRMLIDLYSLIEIDEPFAVLIEYLKSVATDPSEPRKVFETGVHAVWAFPELQNTQAAGPWTAIHYVKAGKADEKWTLFWDRVRMLQRLGAVWFEPWVFSGAEDDAEPLFPASIDDLYVRKQTDGAQVAQAALSASAHLAAERTYLLDPMSGMLLIPLPLHHQTPALRGVARLRVEVDTPGRRLAYGRRMPSVETAITAYDQLSSEALNGEFGRPLRLLPEAR